MRLLVCGGRDWGNQSTPFLAKAQQETTFNAIKMLCPSVLIEGGAPGADSHARASAARLRIKVETFCANWEQHGRAAGPIRNAQMLKEGRPDAVLAFPGGRGTADMVRKAVAAGVPVWEISC